MVSPGAARPLRSHLSTPLVSPWIGIYQQFCSPEPVTLMFCQLMTAPMPAGKYHRVEMHKVTGVAIKAIMSDRFQ